MDRAKHEPTGAEFWATDLKRMDSVERERIRERLVCTGCGGAAYYVPPTKRGTCFFGARHDPKCGERSGNAPEASSEALPEADERALREDTFRLRPYRPRGSHTHVVDDPTGAPHRGRARRYTDAPRGSTSTPSIGLLSLLSRLQSNPEFATSTKRIDLPRGYDQVRRCCVNVADVTDDHRNREKVYWGMLHSAKAGQDGAAWLHTQWEAPNILLTQELLEWVMGENDMDELDEFAGASFIYLGYLNETRDRAWTYFKPKDPEWFAIRPQPNRIG